MPRDQRRFLPDLNALDRLIRSEPLRRLEEHFDEMDADDADDSFFYDDDDVVDEDAELDDDLDDF